MTCVTHQMIQTGAFGGPVLTCRLYVHIFQSGRYVSGYILYIYVLLAEVKQ